MVNALVKRFGEGRTALILPLAGYVVFWISIVVGSFFNLYEPQVQWPYKGEPKYPQVVHFAIYSFLVGLTALGISAVYSRRLAVNSTPTRLTKAAGGFALVSVIISLLIGAIYGIVSLLTGINQGGTGQDTELFRILNLYVPIILDAGLLVFVILKSFVGLHKEGEDE